MKLLVVLQCAWYRDGQPRKRKRWLKDLWNSQTGRRLAEMIPDDMEVCVINASPQTGNHANATFPADPAHIKRWYYRIKPDVILACGTVAHAGLVDAKLEHIYAPHPTWRQLSKKQTAEIREKLNDFRTE